MGKSRRRWGMIVPGSIGAITILCACLWPHERLLLNLATKVVDGGTLPTNHLSNYRWLSDHELFLINAEPLESSNGNDLPSHILRYNLLTHTRTPLARLSSQIPLGGEGWPVLLMSISPDRQWALSVNCGIDTSFLRGYRLDGTHDFTIDSHARHAGQAFWCSDSIHLLEFRNDRFSGQSGAYARRFTIKKPGGGKSEIVPMPPAQVTANIDRFHLISDNRVLGREWTPADQITGEIKVIDIQMQPGHTTWRTFRVPAPPNAAITDLEFSPHDDRIAWLVKQEQVSPMTAYLHRLFPRLKAVPNSTVSIWLSNLDGSHLHEVGHTELELPPPNDITPKFEYPNPGNLQWLPDGKRLSFIYHDALYTVPAD